MDNIMTMKANKDNAEWISQAFQQGAAETGWKEYQNEIQMVAKSPIILDKSSTSFLSTKDISANTSLLLVNSNNNFESLSSVTKINVYADVVNGTVTFNGSYSVAGQDTVPEAVAFSSDGTKMYVVGDTGDDINQYTLTTPWDVLGTVTFNGSYDVSGQETSPQGVAFSSDGTRMYLVGSGGDDINQYTLTTPWDVLGTVTFNGSYSVSSEESTPTGVAFSNDGTRMYVVGSGGDEINQYTLTTPWDVLGTVTFNGSYSVAGQDTVPTGVAFSSDGTRMYVVGQISDDVHQYILTTPWDVLGTVTVDGSYSVLTQVSNPTGVAFSSDGTKMYVVGEIGDDVNQYTIEYLIAYDDITTASFQGSYSVSGQESGPTGVAFSSDGTKMYVVGYSGDAVYQYTLTTPWDVTETVTFNGSYDVSGQDTSPNGVAFSSDGTKMYVVGSSGDDVNQYTLTTPWDVLGTVTFDGSYSVSGQDTSPNGVAFSSDGTKMYVVGASGDDVNQYTLTTPWDVLGIVTFNDSYSVSGQDTSPHGVAFSSDGSRMYVVGMSGDAVYQYRAPLSFFNLYRYDLSSLSLSETPSNILFPLTTMWTLLTDSESILNIQDTSLPILSSNTTSIELDFDNDVDPVFEQNDYITLSKWDTTNIANTSYDSVSFLVSGQDTSPSSIFFKPDGTKMYILGDETNRVFQYTLDTPWVVSTASYDSVSFLVSQESTLRDVFFKPDGTKMYVIGTANDRVYQYTLSTAWDLSTTSYDSVSFSINSEESIPSSIFFKPDGTKMYVIGTSSDTVYQYTLSTAWDVSTASYDSVSFSVNSQEDSPRSIFFKPDGTEMYMLGDDVNSVYKYSLSTAWDVSTASYDSVSFSVGTQDSSPYCIFFKPDGTKMYMVGLSTDTVYQYTLDSTTASDTFQISNISVSNTNITTLQVTADPSVYTELSIQGRSAASPYTNYTYDANTTYITAQTDKITLPNQKTWARFKLIGDTDDNVLNAKVNLWKQT
jgi:sugar lactone lactonase YvrE